MIKYITNYLQRNGKVVFLEDALDGQKIVRMHYTGHWYLNEMNTLERFLLWALDYFSGTYGYRRTHHGNEVFLPAKQLLPPILIEVQNLSDKWQEVLIPDALSYNNEQHPKLVQAQITSLTPFCGKNHDKIELLFCSGHNVAYTEIRFDDTTAYSYEEDAKDGKKYFYMQILGFDLTGKWNILSLFPLPKPNNPKHFSVNWRYRVGIEKQKSGTTFFNTLMVTVPPKEKIQVLLYAEGLAVSPQSRQTDKQLLTEKHKI